MPKNNIYDLSEAELSEWVIAHDLKPYTATQLIDWLYGKRVSSFEEMTNLSKAARAALQDAFEIRRLQEARRHVSTDGSVKFGFQLADGEVIESVLMPQKNRITLCLSSQVGCAMGCGFCKTAEMKLKRNLSQGEILGQVLAAMDFLDLEAPETQHLKSAAGQERVSNIVFMGMGEPLHNLDPVVAAVRILIDPKAFHLSHNKVVVSTSGLAPQIRQFAAAVPAKLAVSLNATNDALRTKIMPINRRYDLKEVIAACQDYARIHGSGVTFEYVLLKDVNDTPEHAAALVRLVAHTPCRINLIPFNEYPGSPYQRPEPERVRAFADYVSEKGFQVNIRYSKGLDILAACGQLANDERAVA